MTIEQHKEFVANYNNPKGGVPLPREALAIMSYENGRCVMAGFNNALYNGSSGATLVEFLFIGTVKYSIPVIFYNYVSGAFNEYNSIQQRMETHDSNLEFYQKTLKP